MKTRVFWCTRIYLGAGHCSRTEHFGFLGQEKLLRAYLNMQYSSIEVYFLHKLMHNANTVITFYPLITNSCRAAHYQSIEFQIVWHYTRLLYTYLQQCNMTTDRWNVVTIYLLYSLLLLSIGRKKIICFKIEYPEIQRLRKRISHRNRWRTTHTATFGTIIVRTNYIVEQWLFFVFYLRIEQRRRLQLLIFNDV